jgi:fructose-1,6-bisphosphatase II / sedoheptulose-1,7-bisphosphatase
MERNLALEVVRATEAAALAAARFIGKGDERMADRAACDAMRKTLNSVAMDGKIVIGEGKEGDAEFLYEGEIVGTGAGTEIDVALDAIEGPIICATGGPNALCRAGGARANPALSRHLHGQGRVRPGRARRDRYRPVAD